MQRSKALALVFLLGTLLVGGVLGFTADRVMTGDRECRRADRAAMRELFARELGLSASQRAAVDSLLDKRHRDMITHVEAIGAGVAATVPSGCGFLVLVWERNSERSVAVGNTQRAEARAAFERWATQTAGKEKA